MKINFPKKYLSLSSYFFVVFFLVAVASCSKDSLKETIDTEMDNDSATDTDNTPDDTSSTPSDISFEEGLVLDVDRSFVNFVLPESEYNKFITGEGDIKMVSKKMYEYLNDDFDYIVILSVEEEQPAGLFYGRATLVQNLVQGIGGGIYNLSTTYGSNGKLKSVIYLPRTQYIKTGPFLHEIAHCWANKGFLPTTVGGHWGYAGTAGQLGGWDELIDNGDGTYQGNFGGRTGFGVNANGANSLPYSNVELYLMGLIPATELESVQVAVKPVKINNSGAFSADAIEVHTNGMMISANGVRIPSSEDSQKDFKALTVVISKTPIDAAKKDKVKENLENFSRQAEPDWNGTYNFHTATQGKASFSFDVAEESIKK